MTSNEWIGFDLDGSLAYYSGWKGPSHIGEPIPEAVKKIKKHLTNGDRVKIFTARVAGLYSGDWGEMIKAESIVEMIEEWCGRHIGQRLEVTCVKDPYMLYCYDDRSKQMIPNTGITLEEIVHGLPQSTRK